MRGSLASGFTSIVLFADLPGEAVGPCPLFLEADRDGKCCEPKEVSLSALTRGYTVTVAAVGLGGSALRTGSIFLLGDSAFFFTTTGSYER